MSYWGAAVITKLLSVVPYFGKELVFFIWGGFSVVSPTLTRFFVLHFLLPFLILGLVIVHIVFLHENGSSKPLGLSSDGDKIFFYPYFGLKDFFGFCFVGLFYLFISLRYPYIFMCYENFMEANVLSTPEHIEPDWFLLMPYAVLRSIPKKLGGVISLVCVIFIWFLLPLIKNSWYRGKGYNVYCQTLF